MKPRALERFLRRPDVQRFLQYHRKVETAKRKACPECFFETGELDSRPSHSPNCSRRNQCTVT
jgi:hypothetical protein